ncbi:MAG: TonB-dependent receptor domain-containing protein, partial [Bryobacteraceae bacterium]
MTAGATLVFSGALVNEFRVYWSRYLNARKDSYLTDSYGAVVPSESELLPSPLEPVPNSAYVFFSDIIENVGILRSSQSLQRQLNFLNTLGWYSGTHQVKIGIDYRALNSSAGALNGWSVFPDTYESLFRGTADYLILHGFDAMSIGIQNYSVFGQDTWRISNRLTLTYGLRCEINTPPVSTMPGGPLYTVQGIFDTRQVALAPGSLWHTRYGNFAPRAGGAFQATPAFVIRGGFGIFYDLGMETWATSVTSSHTAGPNLSAIRPCPSIRPRKPFSGCLFIFRSR